MNRLKLERGIFPFHLFVVFILFFIFGCTIKVPMRPEVGVIDTIEHKIPIDAALLVTEDTKNYIYRGHPKSLNRSARPHEFPLGESLEKASLQTFSQVFQKVSLVRTLARAQKYKITIEPNVEDFHFYYDALSYVGFSVAVASKIKVKVTLASGDANFYEKTIESPEQRKVPLIFNPNFEIDIGESATAALIFVLKRIAEDIAQDVAVEKFVSSLSGPTSTTSIVKSDIDDLPSKKAPTNKNAFAIVIGIEQYRQKLPKADFATSDAETVTKYLTQVMGYPEENVVTLTNDKASKSDFEKYFGKWLSNNVEKGGSVFIYYSGHGAPNTKTGDAYLVPYDGDPAFIDETGYSLKRLYEQLGKLEAKEIVVALDSCFSGAGGRSILAKGARPLVMNMKNSVIPSKVAVLSAASGEQISSTYDEKGHGLFTYFMLKGLKGEAETNGSVEIGNLFEYIKPQVERVARKEYNNEQTPQLIAPKELIGMKLR